MSYFAVTFFLCLFRANWIRFDGILYKKSSALVVTVEEEQPLLVEVLNVYIYKETPILYTKVFETENYNHHHHCFVVKQKQVFRVIDLELVQEPTVYHIRSLSCISALAKS